MQTPLAGFTGTYDWSMEVTLEYPATEVTPELTAEGTFTGTVNEVVGTNNPLGAGWDIQGVDHLVVVCDNLFWVSGTGDYRLFTMPEGDVAQPPESDLIYPSPPEDFGALKQNQDFTFTYTAVDQTRWNFAYDPYSDPNHPEFLLTSVVDPHNLARTYDYDQFGRLVQVNSIDGGVTTIQYPPSPYEGPPTAGGPIYITEPTTAGNRVLTLQVDPSTNNLLEIDDVNGTMPHLRLFRQLDDGRSVGSLQHVHRLRGRRHGVERDLGGGSVWTLISATAGAFGEALAQEGQARWTDGRGDQVIYHVDLRGRQTSMLTPDGTCKPGTSTAPA